ncbi:sporulation protein YjcZ [Paenibacillus sp.]|nr:sporulation protein YjcZ [Paenibacillus sp.]HZG55065.1 sporulation protein YjcZ [Paenibacillus sp.]
MSCVNTAAGVGGFYTSTGAILVLFILLVIISRYVGFGA